VKTFVTQVSSPQSVAFNKTLSKELLALKEGSERRVRADVANNKKADDLFQGLKETRNKNASALCQILKLMAGPARSWWAGRALRPPSS